MGLPRGCSWPRQDDGENELVQPGFVLPQAWDDFFLSLRERFVSALCCVLMERSGVFLVFPTVQAPCRSPTGRSFNRFKRSASMIHKITRPSHAVCNIRRDQHFRLDHYRDAARLYHCTEDLPLNYCNCSAAGRAQRLEWLRRELDPPATFWSILSQNVQLSTNDGAFARRVSSATSTTGEKCFQPPNPSSSPAPTSLAFRSNCISHILKQEKLTTTTLNSKKER